MCLLLFNKQTNKKYPNRNDTVASYPCFKTLVVKLLYGPAPEEVQTHTI